MRCSDRRSAASYRLFSQDNSVMYTELVHVISKYLDKVSKASRTLHEVLESSDEWQEVPQNLSRLILLFQVWKNVSVCGCVCVFLVWGQMDSRLRSHCLKRKRVSHDKAGDAFYLPEHHALDRLQARAVTSCHHIPSLHPEKQQFSGSVALRLETPMLLLVILLRELCWQ